MPKLVQLTLPAQSEFISVARLTVSGIAARMNFNVNDIEDIKVAVSEACTNAIQHAYTPEDPGLIYIDFLLHDNRLEIIVKDDGKGFNTQHIQSKKGTSSDDVFGLGLGIVFIQSLMDDAQINSEDGKGTILTMHKNLPQILA